MLSIGLNNTLHKMHGACIKTVVRYFLQQPGCAEENHEKPA